MKGHLHVISSQDTLWNTKLHCSRSIRKERPQLWSGCLVNGLYSVSINNLYNIFSVHSCRYPQPAWNSNGLTASCFSQDLLTCEYLSTLAFELRILSKKNSLKKRKNLHWIDHYKTKSNLFVCFHLTACNILRLIMQ